MRERNLRFLVATLDQLGVRPDRQDRRRINALADMDSQGVCALHGRHTFERAITEHSP